MDEFPTNNNDQENQDKKNLNILPEEKLEPKMSPFKAGLLGLFGALVFYQIFGGLLTLIVFGTDIENADVNALRLMTMAGQVLFILLPALVFSKLIYENVTKVIRFKIPEIKEIGIFLVGIISLTALLQTFLTLQNYYIELWTKDIYIFEKLKSAFDQLNEMIEKSYGSLLQPNSIVEGVLVIFVVAVTPAICEEVMFRGYIQKSFELKYNKFLGALITALFFGLFHFNPYALIALTSLGLYFGFAAYKTDSIFVPIILHFTNNFVAVILYFIFGDEELKQNKVIPASELSGTWIAFGLLLILFVIVLSVIFYFYHKKNVNKVQIEEV
ncbi:MAG: CPBP family intramembrane metalloprotease [Ignavibacteria bacterium]|nr:CPBP family intramembrane metalloprotease [Ignavibacteria bacterium]